MKSVYDELWYEAERIRLAWSRSGIELLLEDETPSIDRTRDAVLTLCDIVQVLVNEVRCLNE